MVGFMVGFLVGLAVGLAVGFAVGFPVGDCVGAELLGVAVGALLGIDVVGLAVGCLVVGLAVGAPVWRATVATNMSSPPALVWPGSVPYELPVTAQEPAPAGLYATLTALVLRSSVPYRIAPIVSPVALNSM